MNLNRNTILSALPALLLLLPVLSMVGGCSSGDVGERLPNQPPRVWLSGAPPEGAVEKYTVHMYWGGWDPDGEIAYYEFSVTDNGTGPFNPDDTTGADKWQRVHSNDSLLTFTADVLVDSTTTQQDAEFRRSHTFFVRAVDTEGLPSAEPAYRSFTARTLAPSVQVNIPQYNGFNPAIVPPITTFRWTATDYITDKITEQEPDSVQYALVSTRNFGGDFGRALDYLRKDPLSAQEWRPWVYYKADGDSGRVWTTAPLDFGSYVFAIRAKDEARAVTPVIDEVANARRVLVSSLNRGPIFNVNNEFLGTLSTTSCNTPLSFLDVPAGVPLKFSWDASAADYGGVVAGYRYGWDIEDLNDPTQWEVDFTPFTTNSAQSLPRTFNFGTHSFVVEVVDNSGACSRVEVKVNVVQFTMERPIIYVDDFSADKNTGAGWNHPTGLGGLPNDAEHDQFWLSMLDNIAGFNPLTDQIEVAGDSEVPLTQLARYKSIVWSVYSNVGQSLDLPLLYQFVQYRQKNPPPGTGSTGKKRPNLIALYMAAGGHVLIAGEHPVSNTRSRSFAPAVRYPFILLYEQEGRQTPVQGPDISRPIGDQSFGYKDLCVDVLDFAILTLNNRRALNTMYCPVTFLRSTSDSQRLHGMREALPLDTNFPMLRLRPETAGPGKAYNEANRGLDVEVYNPQYYFDSCQFIVGSRICFQPIYGLGCISTTEPVRNESVAFWTSQYADRIAEGIPGAVAARSAVFGFSPVFFNPSEVKPALEFIFFNEWQLPHI